MEQFVPVKMCRRTGGCEFGWGNTTQPNNHPLNVEVLSVGPTFQEIDHRWISTDTRKKPFGRHELFPPEPIGRQTTQQFC